MSDRVKSEMISRRGTFSLVGLAVAMGLGMPITMLTGSDANAETRGMERREERRTGRHERRTERRTKKKKPEAKPKQ